MNPLSRSPGSAPVTQIKVRKMAKTRYNQAPHLTQDANGKVTTSQLDITSGAKSPFSADDHKLGLGPSHKASIKRRTRKHIKNKTEIVISLPEGLNRFHGAPPSPLVQMLIKSHSYLVCMKDPLLINASYPINQDIKRR